MQRILTIAFIALALAGCVSTPYGTMRAGDWAYVQSLPADQQEMAGHIYAQELREWRQRFAESERTSYTHRPMAYGWSPHGGYFQ